MSGTYAPEGGTQGRAARRDADGHNPQLALLVSLPVFQGAAEAATNELCEADQRALDTSLYFTVTFPRVKANKH